MIEHNFPYSSFIGGWYIQPDICDELIEFYDKNKKHAIEAINTDHISDPSIKTGLDLFIEPKTVEKHLSNYFYSLAQCLNSYLRKYEEANNVMDFKINEPFKIQYYKKGQGFHKYHFENDGDKSCNKRHLVFMTYLNDVDNGGTDFLYQKLTSPAKKGLTMIWPAHFTHTHKGQISYDKEKWIMTGWFGFNE